MGKDKKNKKGKQEEDFGEEEVEKQVIVDEKPGKKARKGKSKEVEDSDEEVVPKKKEHAKSKKNHVESDEDMDDVSKKEEPQEKRNKKKGKKAEILSDDDNEEQQPEKKIGKKKGGKKTEVLSDDEVEEQQPEKKNKKKGKKIASEDEESDNEVATNKKSSKPAQKGKKEKKVRVKDRKDESSDEDNVSSKSQPKKGMSAFALLDVEDMDVDMGQSSDEEESKEVTAPKPEADDKKAKKSKKKDRKKKQDDDEDLEKMLEELALEIEGKKPAVAKEKEKTPVDTDKTKTEDGVAADAPKPSAKAKKGKKNEQVKEEDVKDDPVEEMDIGGDDDESGGTVKTAAQKKKEKKERERLKKLAVNANVKIKKDVATTKEAAAPATQTQTPVSEKEVTPVPEVDDEEKDEDDDEKSSKKKKKKGGKGVVEDDKGAKKKPGKKQLAAMQEALKKMKEEEERLRLEEEAKELAAQKAEEERLEKLRLEQERKDKKKQKEKEKKERLKAEGKLLTKAQKQAKARAEATLLALRQQGIDVPKIGEKIERAPRLGDRKKPQKKKTDDKIVEVNGNIPQVEVKIVDSASSSKDSSPEVEEVKESWDEVAVVVEEKVEEIKETWDESSEDESKTKKPSPKVVAAQTKVASPVKKPVKVEKKEESEDEDEDDDDDEESSDEESSSDDDDDDSDASEDDRNLRQSERIREKVLNRIHKRKDENEKNITQDKLRSPVVCVLGHVDTGKTKILDKIRNTHVQDGEAGGITQQIGATMVPNFALKDQCKMVKSFVDMELKLPGLLIIDTPGHESFSNLRSRGSSLCDIAILVVDIMHGLEPQTIESLNMLKQRKTPFVVALNKIDRLYEWKSNKNKDVQDVIRGQQRNTKLEFEDRTKEIILQFNEQGLNAALCYENTDQRTYVSLVPTSAFSGDGMGNLLGLVVELSQTMLAKRLSFSEELQATVLEVKAIPGLGTTIDVILVNGRLREGDTIVLAGHEGAVVTQIRSLLMPQPMKELRVKNPYQEFKEVEAAQGVKIAGKDLDKAIAGLQLLVAHHPDEVEILKEEVSRSLKEVMNAIKLSERGVYVQASTLGSLEALLEFLRTSKIPYSGIRIGPVVKKDVMKASIMLEHDNQYAVILAFDVKVERDAQELADSLGVKIFQANIIYHLFDSFTKYREDLKTKKRNEFKHIAVFPCKLRILPQFIFNSRDPIVVGVSIEAGVIKEGTPLCVPSRENLEIGTVTTIEINHKTVDTARKGQEVCIKIEPIGGEAPKMYGRHFDNTDMLVSKITRQSIDACKDYFRDDLSKTDWQLMVELKKMFQIL